jgi:chromosome partitioning protein
MAITFSVINQKGGVAKTTTTYNIASVLSENGYNVLMIDLDPQSSLSISAGIEPEKLQYTITDVLISFNQNKKQPIENTIIKITENLHIVPSIIDLSAADNLLHNEMSRESILKKALLPINDIYDFIFIDCPPSLGQLPINALVASDYVLIPVSTTYLAYRGLNLLVETIDKVRENLNESLKIYGVVATLHTRTIHAKEILQQLEEEYRILGVVGTSVKTMDSIYTSKAIVDTDKRNPVAKAYKSIAEVLIEDKKKGMI